MTDIAIKVEGLSKLYRIGAKQARYKTLRESLTDAFTAPFRRVMRRAKSQEQSVAPSSPNSMRYALSSVQPSNDGFIWALKDVSFEIKHGEVVGIIGRNGAGKSTLLKILSRITEPTEGYADIHGRVGSLLEVGTGFHSELTGRENIYLNGAILGMKKAEIERKFDEIVAFAEVEKFIDTPVKHYSTGMYLRLAFAVAAHLEPEILLVDEVLAVGDAAFQKKCLGKMGEVAQEGRTILFVSHNMQAVQALCGSAIQLEAGHIATRGDSRSVVAQYLSATSRVGCQATWPEQIAPGNQEVKLTAISVYSQDGNVGGIYSSNQSLQIAIKFVVNTNHSALCVGFDLITPEGVTVLRSYQTDLPPEDWPPLQVGENHWYCTIPGGLLNAGSFYVCPRIGMHNMYWIVNIDAVVQFEVILDHGVSPFWNALDSRNRPGIIAPILNWNSL